MRVRVFPVSAGMNRHAITTHRIEVGVPRERGDEPGSVTGGYLQMLCSP